MSKRILLPELRNIILAFNIFEKWGIDIVGPLPMTGRGNAYILTAVDYLSRCAEAKPVKAINKKTVCKFVYEEICYRYGMPLEIVSHNGPGFRSELLDLLCEKLKIKHRYTTPHYPQCNARNEYFNGELTGIIGKMIRIHEKSWNLALPVCEIFL